MSKPVEATIDLHHAHLFAVDIDATLAWWCRHLGAKGFFDEVLAGARNVFVGVGTGRLHIYDQAPKDRGGEPSTTSDYVWWACMRLGRACRARGSSHPAGCASTVPGGTS